jgi:hypothetical protein
MMTMSSNEVTKRVLDFQKGAFASWYGTISKLQDNAASAVDTMLNQTSWIPDEGRQVISSWASTCKNERDRYKVYLEESFSVLEKHLDQDIKDAPARPDKPAAEAKTAASAIKSKAAAVDEQKAPAAQETKQSIK